MPDIELMAALKVLVGRRRRRRETRAFGRTGGVWRKPARSIRFDARAAQHGARGDQERQGPRCDRLARPATIREDRSRLGSSARRFPQLLDQMQQSFAQMGAPFPDEPIGVGARWTVNTLIAQQGMKVQQVATYELTELERQQRSSANSS